MSFTWLLTMQKTQKIVVEYMSNFRNNFVIPINGTTVIARFSITWAKLLQANGLVRCLQLVRRLNKCKMVQKLWMKEGTYQLQQERL